RPLTESAQMNVASGAAEAIRSPRRPRRSATMSTPMPTATWTMRSEDSMPGDEVTPRHHDRPTGSGHDLVDLVEDLRAQSLDHLERGQILLELLDRTGAGDHGRHIRIREAPRDRQSGDRRVDPLCDIHQAPHLVVLVGSGQLIRQPLVTRK